MNKFKLIYISSNYLGPVIEGQVYKLLDYYQDTGWFSDVVLLQQYIDKKNLLCVQEVLKNHSFKYKFFKGNQNYPISSYFTKKSLKKILLSEVKDEIYIIHVRDILLCSITVDLLSSVNAPLNLLCEFRGSFIDETLYLDRGVYGWLKNRIKIPFYLHHSYKLFNNKRIKFTAVSEKMREYQIEAGVNPTDIYIHPNIVSNKFIFDLNVRNEVRNRLGIKDNQCVVVISSGDDGPWQNDRESIDFFTSKGFIVLNLSKTIIDKNNVINMYIPHDEMPSYLSAGDVAILWREHITLNEVSSPSKFSEFAVMGLYVIHNKSVDVASKFIADNNSGQLVDNIDEIQIDPEKVLNINDRIRRCKLGFKRFSVQNNSISYYNKYCDIIKLTMNNLPDSYY